MITFYSGTPGSGKSLDVAREIIFWLKMGKPVIGNMYLNESMISKYKGKYYFVDTYAMNPRDFIAFSRKNLIKGKEGQCLIVIDECHRIFNSRTINDKNRPAWLDFFSLHRQFGFECYLVAQWDRQIDRQIRAQFEYEVKHRKGNNMGNIGFVLSLFCGTFFVRMENWYGSNQRLSSTFFRYHKKWGRLYDSYMAFDENEKIEKRNDLLQFVTPPTPPPPPVVPAVVVGGGQGVPADDGGGTVAVDGYKVDQYGFIIT